MLDAADLVLTIILIGDAGVGKSHLAYRFTSASVDEGLISTIGAEYKSKTLTLDDMTVNLRIWDTSGQERYRAITRQYYRGADAALVVYSVSDLETFKSLSGWLDDLRDVVESPIPVMLVGNKIDLEDQRSIQTDDGLEFAKTKRLLFTETSAVQYRGVDEAFEQLAERAVQEKLKMKEFTGTPRPLSRLVDGMPVPSESQGEKRCC
jgi:small GTP-binding protein